MEDQILEGHFTAIQSDFNQIYERFDEVNKRFEQVDQRFDEVNKRFEQVDQRFDAMDKRFDKVESKLDRLETVGFAILEIIKGNDVKLRDHEGRLLRLERKAL